MPTAAGISPALDEMTEDDLTSYRTEAGALDGGGDGGGGLRRG